MRTHFALVIAAAMGVWAALDFFQLVTAGNRQAGDPYHFAEQLPRYESLAAALPPDAALGYLSDLPADDTRAQMMFFAAQYALAPRLVRTAPEGALALGNFTQPVDFAAQGAKHGLRLDRDFGSGVILYRK